MNGFWRRWRRRLVPELEAKGAPRWLAELIADEEAETRSKAEPICGRAAALAGEVSHHHDGFGWRRRLNVHRSDVPPERQAACEAWQATHSPTIQ
jgi:hypothetical protein